MPSARSLFIAAVVLLSAGSSEIAAKRLVETKKAHIAAAELRCKGAPNTIPVTTAAPVLTKTVPNGKLYIGGAGEDTFKVIHLYGTPYEQGYARGQLIGSDMADTVAAMPAYVEQMVSQQMQWMPQWLVDFLGVYGTKAVLDLIMDMTKPFLPDEYVQEFQGLADATGVDVKDVWRVNLYPEAIKAACTIVGATGPATPNGKIGHLRGLDFGIDNPLRDFPAVTVHHNEAQGKPSIANFGWTVFTGVLTGFSQTGLGVGEKVWIGDNASSYDGLRGKPWMYILRDAIEQPNIWAALDSIQSANRTCAIHAGIGDNTVNTFRGVEMAQKYFQVFNDTSIAYPQHPVIPGVFYWDKHVQPTSHYCLSDLLQYYNGNLSAEVLALSVAPTHETGEFHSVAFDYANQIAFFANTRKANVTTGSPYAYARQYTKLSMGALFDEQQ